MLLADALTTPGADSAVFTVSAPIVTAVIGTVLPLLVGLVTKWTTSSKVKAWLLVALNAVSSAIVTAVVADGSAVFSNQFVLTFIMSFLVSGAAYARIWRPTGLSSSTPGPMSGPGVATDPAFVGTPVVVNP